jgi:hypothetical protein
VSADLSNERFAVAAARQAHESALRALRTAEAHADKFREPDGSFMVVDQGLNPDMFAEIAGLQPALDAGTAEETTARAGLDAALQAYAGAAVGAPLFDDGGAGNADPVLLLPVRLEAIYVDADPTTGRPPELRIRVYPDEVHVDAHEPALTEGERDAGIAHWRATLAAGDDAMARQAAWQALVGAVGGARATWVRDALTPLNDSRTNPEFPDVELREAAWTRAAHTLLLPDHFEFSAYRDGARVWRHDGEPIPDTLAVGVAPEPQEGGEEAADGPSWDEASRWLIDFDLAKEQGMALAVELADVSERYDLLTAVGVGTQDGATGAERVQGMLAAHAWSNGLAPLPLRTPTNNTPGSRSGWRSRGVPPDPEVVAARRAAFDPAGDQEAARVARALGVDGSAVLASVCDPDGGDEALLARLHALQARFYSWSRAFRPVSREFTRDAAPPTEPWLPTVIEHFTRFVRARGALPPLRIGRQPYGILPVSATGLWQGDDVDPAISRFVGSFLETFAMFAGRARQVGEDVDQDALLLDLLSREANPGRLVRKFDSSGVMLDFRAPPSTVGAIPATSTFAWLQADLGPGPDEPGGDRDNAIEAFPDAIPDGIKEGLAQHPLLEMLVLFEESINHMRDTLTAPDPAGFHERLGPQIDRVAPVNATPLLSRFYDQAEWSWNTLRNICSGGPDSEAAIAARVEEATPFRDLFADYAQLEEDASRDLPHFERAYRETFEPLSHRIDAWVTSLATARLDRIRAGQPTGIRYGAYGWLTDVESLTPNPQREGYLVTPSMHHATTAAVLRSGWQAHSDRRAFAVDIQSARVRRAQAVIEGVRAGQTVDALLGYQFERALHDAELDHFIAGFRSRYPLAPLVEPAAPGADQARGAIGARNVVDGQALRRDRPNLGSDEALAAAAGAPLDGNAPALRRMLGELDETFDAVGDLLLAESVHQLVGGSPLRAGLAADVAGRGQDLPLDYDVLRTPRGGVGVTHHVGIRFPESLRAGWPDDRPLVRLQPGLEAWLRRRLGPASSWGLEELGWCATEIAIAPAEVVRAALEAHSIEPSPDKLERLLVVCERLRSALATAVPLTPLHLDPAEAAPLEGFDLGELHDRVSRWLGVVREAAGDLGEAGGPEAVGRSLERLRQLGISVGLGGVGDADRVRALLAEVELAAPPAPPDPASAPADADAWLAAVLATSSALLHPAVKAAAVLKRDLPPSPAPPPEPDTVGAWLNDMVLVRPKVDALDRALVAAEVLAGTSPSDSVVAQPVASENGPAPWLAVAPPDERVGRPQCSLVLSRDGGRDDAVSGIVIDSWTEVVPRTPGEHGPEEVVGVAFDFDRPGARAPQSMLVAVPPDPARGWCMEDLHACLDEALLLARIRTLDLEDMPEMRTVLPIPNPEG